MSGVFDGVVDRLSRIAGVRGALIVDAETALPVSMELRQGINGTGVAALATSLFRRTTQASAAARFGRLLTMQLEAEQGHVVAVGTRDLLLVVVTDPDAPLGLIRLEAVRAAEELA
jgi:predicted regulator of Ras-like GTPase activity (Roadblock/LC7/MglB family)